MKVATDPSSSSLQWLLEFNVNELLPEDDGLSNQTDQTPQHQNHQEHQPPEIMSIRKSTRVRVPRKISVSEDDYGDLEDPSPPPVARFEECSSSSSDAAASSDTSANGDKKQKMKRRKLCNGTQLAATAPAASAETSDVCGGSRSREDESFKPRCTYTELIEKALQENPEGLTVSQIYSWIAKNHTFFRLDDDRWKNSVRHNLSINPYFEKRGKCKNGAGHVWTIAESCRQREDGDANLGIEEMDTSDKKTTSSYSKQNGRSFKTETERIVGGILQQYKIELNNNRSQQQAPQQRGRKDSKGKEKDDDDDRDDEEGEKENEKGKEGEIEIEESEKHATNTNTPMHTSSGGCHSPIVNEHEDLLITTGVPGCRQASCQNGHLYGHGSPSDELGCYGSHSSNHSYIDYSELFAPPPQPPNTISTVPTSQYESHHSNGGFNEFELLTLEALEANNNQDNYIIIHAGGGHELNSTGAGLVPMDMSHSFYAEELARVLPTSRHHAEHDDQLISIQTDHLFHTKELLLAADGGGTTEDESQITTMQL